MEEHDCKINGCPVHPVDTASLYAKGSAGPELPAPPPVKRMAEPLAPRTNSNVRIVQSYRVCSGGEAISTHSSRGAAFEALDETEEWARKFNLGQAPFVQMQTKTITEESTGWSMVERPEPLCCCKGDIMCADCRGEDEADFRHWENCELDVYECVRCTTYYDRMDG